MEYWQGVDREGFMSHDDLLEQIAALQQMVRIQQRELIEKQAAIDVLKAEKREAQGEVRP
jgi:hypothetical protein